MKIAVFYHGLFSHGTPREIRPAAFGIVREAMACLETSGLGAAADEIHTCFNGDEEEEVDYARLLVPPKAQIVFHGLQSFAENLTIIRLWEWSKSHPGWAVLYFHAKGCTHDPADGYAINVSWPWRRTMLQYMVLGWRQCVADIESGADIVCPHWLWNQADGTQHIPAGNFLWANSSFVASLPSMHDRARIKLSGIAAAESRYEAEVFWGNGRRPIVAQHLPNGGGGVP